MCTYFFLRNMQIKLTLLLSRTIKNSLPNGFFRRFNYSNKMSSCKTVKLSSGYDMPVLGFGTWQATEIAEKLKPAIKVAIETGYRMIDTAFVHSNEQVLGETLNEIFDSKIVKREDIFITTKLFPSYNRKEDVILGLKTQLASLKTDYVDLYLIHFPVALKRVEGKLFPFGDDGKIMLDADVKLEDTWAGMEECVKAGLARSIGLSNFNMQQIERILKVANIKPAMNQIESHPAFQNTELIEYCQSKGIAVTAYAPFGSPGTLSWATKKPLCEANLLEDPVITEIGKKYGKKASQVILRWQMQRHVIVIPKSVTPDRIKENFDVWNFELSADDMKAIAALDTNKRTQLWLPGTQAHAEYPYLELIATN